MDRDKFALFVWFSILLVMILTQTHMQQSLLHNRHLYQPVQPVMTHKHDTHHMEQYVKYLSPSSRISDWLSLQQTQNKIASS